jgi:hypothetical protein
LAAGDNWKLSISDNGIGVPDAHAGRLGQRKSSLGTSIVKALAQRLEAGVDVLSGTTGTIVSITHATLAASTCRRKITLAPVESRRAHHGRRMCPYTSRRPQVEGRKERFMRFARTNQSQNATPPKSSTNPRKISAPKAAPLRESSRHVGM